MSDEEGEEPTGVGTYEGARLPSLDTEGNETGFGLRHGEGVSTYKNGDIYEGTYANGKRNGQGTYYFGCKGDKAAAKATYTGSYVDHKKCGQGTMKYPNGTTYVGEWKDDLREGQGVYTYGNGDTYSGEWKAGKKGGAGTYTSKGVASQPSEVVGAWTGGAVGQADWRFADGSRYVGAFGAMGKPEGQGKFVMANGNAIVGTYTATVREDPEDEENLNTVGGEWAPTEGGVSAAFAGDMMSEMETSYAAVETTYAMVKPNAVAAGATEAIIDAIKEKGFKIVQSEEASLSAEQAETFYAEHKGKAFFANLIAFMTSGPVVKLILKKEGAIKAWRELLGPTNSLTAKAEAPRSLRSLYGIDGTQNAAHGSDSVESAAREIDLMFPQQSTLLMYKALTPADAATIDQQLMFGGFTVTEKEETVLNDWEGAPLGVITKLIISKRGAVSAAAALTVAGCEFVYVSPNVAQAAADIDQIFPVQQTYAMIKPDAVAGGTKDAIMAIIADAGFAVLKEEETTLTEAEAKVLYSEHAGADFYDALVAFMCTLPPPEPVEGEEEPEEPEPPPPPNTLVKLVLEKRGAVTAWRTLMGPTDAGVNKEGGEAGPPPADCIRTKFASEEDPAANAVHGSKTPAAAIREIDLMFPCVLSEEEAAMASEETYAMVKPHAMAALAEILMVAANHGFTVAKQETATLTPEDCEGLYVEHKEKEFYGALVESVTGGEVVKLCLARPNAVAAWRALIGPTSAVVALADAPASLRARFGDQGAPAAGEGEEAVAADPAKNAVHGSKTVESAAAELLLMFPPPPEPEPEAEGEAEAEPEPTEE